MKLIEVNEETGMATYQCESCDGKGEREYMKNCTVPISQCCGGCTETLPCHECNGTGTIEKEYESNNQ